MECIFSIWGVGNTFQGKLETPEAMKKKRMTDFPMQRFKISKWQKVSSIHH